MQSSKTLKQLRRAVLEGLETRTLFDQTYFPLTLGSMQQNWTNPNQITANDNWTGVLSIEGYRGDNGSQGTGVNPQTVLLPLWAPTDTPPGVLNMLANTANPDTFNTGGVAEFDTIANPTVALNGSGTADNPFVIFYLDCTGVSNVPISYNLRDIDGSADNTNMQVALQYRLGTSGNFTDIPAGYVADATTGPNLATLVTPVSTNLPAACDGQAQVQVRVMTTNAGGVDEWVGVDDIVIGTGSPAPTLQFSATSYTVNEGDGTATITVTRSPGGLNSAASIQYATSNGSAIEPGDYGSASGTLNFVAFDDSESFTVSIVDDGDPELAETINLTLSNASGALLATPKTAVLTIAASDVSAPAILMNEVNINPPDDDGPHEYVEIRGTAGASLLATYFVSIEGDGELGAAGTADLVVDLSAATPGSSGLLMIRSASGHAAGAGTNTIDIAALNASTGGLENDSNSFAVIFSPTPIVQGTDLDPNNDGVLDLPSGATLIDCVGWRQNGASPQGIGYGAVLPLLSAVPLQTTGAATRINGDNNPNTIASWYYGVLLDPDTTGGDNSDSLVYGTNVSANTPASAVITPGATNFGGTDTIAPTIQAGPTFNFDVIATPMSLTVDFSENVQASLSLGGTLQLLNLDTNTAVPNANMILSYGAGDVATITFQGFPQVASALPAGDYRLTVTTGVQDAAGNPLATAATHDFFFINGDATRDRTVNGADFNVLLTNFGATSGKSYTLGDFTFDGAVNGADFNVMLSNFGFSVPGDSGRFTLPGGGSSNGSSGGIFGDTGISDDSDSILA